MFLSLSLSLSFLPLSPPPSLSHFLFSCSPVPVKGEMYFGSDRFPLVRTERSTAAYGSHVSFYVFAFSLSLSLSLSLSVSLSIIYSQVARQLAMPWYGPNPDAIYDNVSAQVLSWSGICFVQS